MSATATVHRASPNRVALLAGVVAPAVFIPLDLADGLVRPATRSPGTG